MTVFEHKRLSGSDSTLNCVWSNKLSFLTKCATFVEEKCCMLSSDAPTENNGNINTNTWFQPVTELLIFSYRITSRKACLKNVLKKKLR